MAQIVAHLPWALAGKGGDGAVRWGKAALGMHGQPWTFAGLFANAVCVLTGMAQGAAVEQTRDGATGVQQHQAYGPANGGVGTIARPKEVVVTIDLQLVHH